MDRRSSVLLRVRSCWPWLVLAFPLAAPSAQLEIRGFRGGRFDTRLHHETFASLAAGHTFTLFLRADGSITGVGSNGVDQLDFPAPSPGLSYVDLIGGEDYSMALRSDGAVLVRAVSFSGYPAVPALPPGVTYVDLEGGLRHIVALRSDGQLAAWGDFVVDYGQANVPALPAGVAYVEASAGTAHSLARRSDGVVVGFGRNTSGECDVPSLAPGLSWTEVAAGTNFSLGLVSDGSLRAWGSLSFVPSAPSGTSFVDVEAGGSPLARRSDGRVFTWSGPTTLREIALPPGRSAVQLSGVSWHSAVRLDDGKVVYDGYLEYSENNSPPAPPGVTYRQVTSGAYHGLLLLGDGTIRAWGSNNHGQCNVPALPSGLVYTRVATALTHSVALRNDGSVVNFGQYFGGLPRPPAGRRYLELAAGHEAVLGLLDDGRVLGYLSAPPALPAGLSYTKIAAGYDHELAIRSDGKLIAWGRNDYGQCNVPTLPAGLAYLEADGGQLHTVALRSDGNVIAFGYNAYGQCNVPALPAGLAYVEAAAGPFTSTARRSDGSFVSWGSTANSYFEPPPLAPGEAIRSFDGDGNFLIERPAAPGAPDLVRSVPEVLAILSPGLTQDVTLLGSHFSALTALALDGAPIDPARYTVVDDGTLTLDLPQLATPGAHDLLVTDGVNSDPLQVTVAAPLGPRLEFEDGQPLTVIDRDDGLTFRVAGPVGSQHQLYLSSSPVPSTAYFAHLDMGNGFTDIIKAARFVIPPQGWIEVFVPSPFLPVTPPGGTAFYAQTLMLRPPLPFPASNLQSMLIVP